MRQFSDKHTHLNQRYNATRDFYIDGENCCWLLTLHRNRKKISGKYIPLLLKNIYFFNKLNFLLHRTFLLFTFHQYVFAYDFSSGIIHKIAEFQGIFCEFISVQKFVCFDTVNKSYKEYNMSFFSVQVATTRICKPFPFLVPSTVTAWLNFRQFTPEQQLSFHWLNGKIFYLKNVLHYLETETHFYFFSLNFLIKIAK